MKYLKTLFIVFLVVQTFIIHAQSNTYKGHVIVKTQAQVNAFRNKLKGKTKIAGSLTIGYIDEDLQSNITDLSPLRNITHITGYLTIRQNGKLVNLNTLNNIKSIDKLYIYGNSKLTSIKFPNLQTVRRGFSVNSNPKLTSLNFPVLRFIGGDFDVSHNFKLTDFGEFPVLKTIRRGFGVRGNDKLTDVGEFPVLKTVGGEFNVWDNDSLADVGDFPVLQSIGGRFRVRDNSELTDLGDFPVLKSIEGSFNVSSNNDLTDLGDFPVLKSIEGSFSVSSNNDLTDLGYFPVLQSIRGYFEVKDNDQLISLGGFRSLRIIGGLFNVVGNNSLTSLGNFSSLESVVAISVIDNIELNYCCGLNELIQQNKELIGTHISLEHNGEECYADNLEEYCKNTRHPLLSKEMEKKLSDKAYKRIIKMFTASIIGIGICIVSLIAFGIYKLFK